MSVDFTFKEDKKILLVANYLYSPLLFEYKNSHPSLDIKFMTLEEVKDLLTFTYLKDPIPYLIKEKKIEYNKAKKYVSLLKSASYYKNPFLKALYEELKGEYIPTSKDTLDLYELNLYNIYLFEDDEDIELKALLNKNGLQYEDLHFEDLEFKETDFFNNPDIKIYTSKFEQFFSLFASLREEIIRHPEKKDDIYILCSGGEDLYYVNYFSKMFGIDVFTNISTPLINNPLIARKLNEIRNNKSFIFQEDELENEYLLSLCNLIKEYDLENIDNFDFAYLNLEEIVNAKNSTESLSNSGLLFGSKLLFSKGYEINVTNFQDGVFYRIYKDNNVLSDSELLNIEANPSYYLTNLDRRLKLNFLKYTNIKFLSRVEQHLDDKIYHAPFINELNWKKYVNHEDMLFNNYFTKEAYEIYKAYTFDNAFYHKKDDLTNSYDHSFKGLSSIKDLLAGKSLSVSSIKTYTSCPFKYYLEKIIPIFDDEKHNAWKGTLIHSVLEDIYLDNYDYQSAFEKGKKEYYKAMEKEGYEYGKKEEIFLDIIKYWLYPIIVELRKERKDMKIYFPLKRDYEISINYKVGDNSFYGSVDKIIFSDLYLDSDYPTSSNKFYTIIDYKTGSHSNNVFNPLVACTGYDIQLPLYYYGLLNGESIFKEDGAEIGGLGIRHIYGSKIRSTFFEKEWTSESILLKSFAIGGIFSSKLEYYQSLADVELTKKGTVKNKKIINSKDEFYIDEKGYHPFKYKLYGEEVEYSLEEMIDDTLEAVEKRVNDILNGDFKIAPIKLDVLGNGEKLTCSYCPYKDVCYHDIKDVNDLSKEVEDKFIFKNQGGQKDA